MHNFNHIISYVFLIKLNHNLHVLSMCLKKLISTAGKKITYI